LHVSKKSSHRVAAIVADGSNPFEVTVAVEMFGLPRPEIGDWYDFTLCAPQGRATMRDALFAIEVAGLEAVAGADTVIAPNRPDVDTPPNDLVLEAIRAAHDDGARMVSFCTGAFTLAAAGVLDGRTACTHWMYADAFRQRFPRVDLRPDVLFVEDDGVFTSAGGAAAIDLSMHLVGIDFGREAANTVSRMLVYPGNRDGERQQFVQRPVPRSRDESLSPLLQWAEGRLAERLGVAELAEQAAMSPATLHRRFRSELGCTPLEWINAQRVDLARRLIETTLLDFEAVAARSGLGTAASLRIHIRQRLGMTPSAYRQRFNSTAYPAALLNSRR
jgi:AraC family transcriptional regulator, transcriptional activator FtrA